MAFNINQKVHYLADVEELFREDAQLIFGDEAKQRVAKCREYLDNRMKTQKDPIYGITTGFGSLCNVSIDAQDLSQLQKNLVMSHACSIGEEVPQDIVKLMMAFKVKSLAYGYSGVRVETVQRLVDMFNNKVYPVVYQQGSLGASGDLAPLANMCLPMLGLGEVNFEGKKHPAAEINKKFGWEPLTLASKEGLALLNGTQFMLSFAVWNLIKAKKLSALADKIAALSIDAFDGRIEPFTPGVHAIRPHSGQMDCSHNLKISTR
jgi:Histidine ammonia-lyase